MSFFHRLYIILAGLLLITLLAACAGPAATPAPLPATPTSIQVNDALGRTINLPRSPQRIVVAGRAIFMIADALYLFPNVSSRIVAIGKFGQSQRNFIPALDPTYESKVHLEIDAGPEQIVPLRPDVVLLKAIMAERLGKPLEELGIPVVYLDLETAEQYQRDLMMLGELFQNERRARELQAFFQQRVERITKALADVKEEQKPRVLLISYSERDGTVAFNVPPAGWIQTWMVQTAGGRPIWTDAGAGQGWIKVGMEQIAAWDPDQVYVIAYNNPINQVVDRLKADPQWKALRSVKTGRLYGFPGDYYSWDQPDTRWILGLTWLAGRVHPDRFPELNMEREIRTFYKELYYLDDEAFQKLVQSYLSGDWQ